MQSEAAYESVRVLGGGAGAEERQCACCYLFDISVRIGILNWPDASDKCQRCHQITFNYTRLAFFPVGLRNERTQLVQRIVAITRAGLVGTTRMTLSVAAMVF